MRVPTTMMIAATLAATSAARAAADVAAVKAADYTFAYRYPAEAEAIPALRARLDAERARMRAATARDAAASRREANGSDFPFHAHETQKTWKVVTNTPRFLSLSSDSYSYTGGAHGTPSSGALLWDKAAGEHLSPVAVFTSAAALQRAIAPTYCARLKAERARRLAPFEDTGGMFAECPSINELTLLLGSTDRRRIDRIGLIADPYVAGSYAEGAYEVTLPVTRAVLATVKPRYRAAFAAR